jgi:cytoplasmic iron level regulating protein YaaA (DUF328/UPF0246 family)
MLILLPPSEGKSGPAGGPPVDLDALVFADELRDQRERLMTKLEMLAGRPVARAIEALGISAGQAGDVERDGRVRSAPSAPASQVYTGVLFDRLDFAGLKPAAAGRANDNVLISSALWGFLRPDDRIPYYRLSMKARLPRVSGLAAYWRPSLGAAMESGGHDLEDGLVLDMRSGAYSTAWKPKRSRLLQVRAFTESGGERKAVSHMAKATRGEVARLVLSTPAMPADAESVAGLLEESGLTVELSGRFLDVIRPT